MNVLLVSGEASGDAHGAALVKALREKSPDVKVWGMGGPRLEAAGMELVFSMREISVMGLFEVLPKLFRILSVMRALERLAKVRRPEVAVLIDVPDFNLRLAARLKRLGIRVVYYVSPMVWASRKGRVHRIARVVDQLLCILPFEPPHYDGTGLDVRYVGHPLLDELPAPCTPAAARERLGLDPFRDVVAVLPGSRRSEVTRIFPVLLSAVDTMRARGLDFDVVVPVAPGLDRAFVESFAGTHPVRFVDGRAHDVMSAARVCLLASGTVSLEAALLERPMVVTYKMSPFTYAVARLIVTVRHVSLPNLILNRALVPELLQGAATASAIADAGTTLWSGPARESQLAAFASIRTSLGAAGASATVAQAVLNAANSPSKP